MRAGEVLGFAGLVGAGRSEIAQALFGLDHHARGRIHVAGELVTLTSPGTAMHHGIGLVPEDRKRQGLVLSMSALSNTTLATLGKLARLGFIRRARRSASRPGPTSSGCGCAPPARTSIAAGLSGGNQQKLVLAKWLAAQCRILILDEPTRGVDVGAKAEIHALIDELAADGCAVILISSELPEVMHLSTRILVLREGRIAGELAREEATQAAVMRLMAGVAEVSGFQLKQDVLVTGN